MPTFNELGHTAGALVFGIFLALLWRDRQSAPALGRLLPAFAASLALLWNVASLFLLTNPAPLSEAVFSFLAYGALSLLPAVLLDIYLQGRLPGLVRLGYVLGFAAMTLHGAEWITGAESPHRLALIVSSALSGALTLMAGWRLWKLEHHAPSRLFGAMALFLLSLTFTHFDKRSLHGHSGLELIIHHASLPLALLILLQDYRFVLLDAFVRFLANILLATAFTVAWWAVVTKTTLAQQPAWLFAAATASFIAYAFARGLLQKALSTLVFGRASIGAALEQIRRLAARAPNAETFLQQAAELVAGHVAAESWSTPILADAPTRPALLSPVPAVQVVVPLRLASDDLRVLALGRRRGGRRYLSEDLDALARLASALNSHWESFREQGFQRLVAQAELRALQSQIHPHFLFNALNTLYGVIPRQAGPARSMVLNLADIFRYFLRNEKTFLPLEEEIHIVKAYLEIETLRLGDKLTTELRIAPEALLWSIPALSLQPLVENAVRHGIAPLPQGGRILIEAQVQNETLLLTVEDTGQGPDSAATDGEGVGLDNVRRRLALCYGPDARVDFRSVPGLTQVTLHIPSTILVPAA